MANVKLIGCVTHDGEAMKPGEIISGLTDKAAARLVRFGVAVLAADPPPGGGDPGGTGDDPNVVPGGAANGDGDDGQAVNIADIKAMKKDEIIAALKDAGVEGIGNKNKAELEQMLFDAWTAPPAAE